MERFLLSLRTSKVGSLAWRVEGLINDRLKNLAGSEKDLQELQFLCLGRDGDATYAGGQTPLLIKSSSDRACIRLECACNLPKDLRSFVPSPPPSKLQ